MSQRTEKLRRRVEKLEADTKQIRQAQIDSDRFTACLYSIREQTDQEAAANRRKARKAVRTAKQCQRTAWLAMIAMMLCAALCLTLHVRASAEPPNVGILASETVEDAP